jgi:hypothetical protein
MTYEAWREEGTRRFGADFEQWKFVCPVCAHVAKVADFKQFKDRGATPNSATAECIGRYTGAGEFKPPGTGPCNYAGYGFFRLSPVHVVRDDPNQPTHSFAFADPVQSQ